MSKVTLLFALVVSVALLSTCDRTNPIAVPEGVQTLTGTLLSAEISLMRRGTHMIQVDGEPVYFVESAKVNLRSFEGKRVQVQGKVERNTDPEELPVLVADSVKRVTDPLLRTWDFPELRIHIDTPKGWTANEDGEEIVFSGEMGDDILRIYPQMLEDLPFDFDSGVLTSAEANLKTVPIVVGSTRAVHVLNASEKTQSVYFELETQKQSGTGTNTVLTFLFKSPAGLSTEMDEKFLDSIHSLTFDPLKASSRSASSRSARSVSSGDNSSVVNGSTEGGPCGGPAGILCAPGYYCAVTDVQTNIGKCQKL